MTWAKRKLCVGSDARGRSKAAWRPRSVAAAASSRTAEVSGLAESVLSTRPPAVSPLPAFGPNEKMGLVDFGALAFSPHDFGGKGGGAPLAKFPSSPAQPLLPTVAAAYELVPGLCCDRARGRG